MSYDSTEILRKRLGHIVDNAWQKLKKSGLSRADIEDALHGRMDAIQVANEDDTPTPEYLFASLLMDCKRLQARLKVEPPELVSGYVMAAEIQCKELSQLPLTLAGYKSKTGGGTGGKAPKRREWAQWACTRATNWEELPEAGNPWVFDVNAMQEVHVYRDGDKLVAFDPDTEKETSLARSTIEKRYLKGPGH